MRNPTSAIATIDDYISGFPKDTQKILRKMRQTIRAASPDAEEVISYRMPTFRLNRRNLVHFAAFENHIGFYPIPSGIEAFKKELAPYKQGKGSVQFPLDRPIPFELVRKIVAYRAAEERTATSARAAARGKTVNPRFARARP